MSKHTPGPWGVGIKQSHGTNVFGYARVALSWCGANAAYSFDGGPSHRIDGDEAYANALLCAAAPELLEALENAVSEHEARVGECCCGICDPAKAAIRKAKGEA